MKKKVLLFGGGTGMSTLLKGLKEFPIEITTVVSVCDDGKSTGKLREEFNIPAVGDIRKVLVALSETEPLIEDLFNYRFQTTSDLNGHTVGNLLLTALANITGNMSDGIESLSKVLNLKGKVLPLTEDNVVLMGKMEDGSLVKGEHNITQTPQKVIDVFYEKEPEIPRAVIQKIKEADLIIFTMGSLFTSILPNLLSKEIIHEIDGSKAKLMYVCNMMTQPGETDKFKTSDHIKTINRYLGNRKLDSAIINTGAIDTALVKKYETLEQKDLVEVDLEEVQKLVPEIITNNYATITDSVIRHNVMKVSADIFSSII
ncbi:MAG: uridine diphosphate-N-acetylglucosamine-binding protein YvcK [Bacilli bacterium]|nr:uridine diphosphate-N-acetylglucosamine-binding protein YvcK [Bacilli bacterium]